MQLNLFYGQLNGCGHSDMFVLAYRYQNNRKILIILLWLQKSKHKKSSALNAMIVFAFR